MRDSNQAVALQAVEFWSTVCEVEIALTLEAEEVSRVLEGRKVRSLTPFF
jgi:hypothetical protein